MSKEDTGIVFFDGKEISYTIIYSNRKKSWTIEVKPDGSVFVRVPQLLSAEKARELAQEKAEWIGKQVEKYTTRVKVVRQYKTGETLPFLGCEYPIVRRSGACAKAELSNGEFILTLPDTFSEEDKRLIAKDLISMLYRRIGTKPLNEIVQRYAPIANVDPPRLRIKIQERKWGCCTPKNGIIINARVLLAPKIVAEYIVVHELAHIRFRHHQKSFWDEVERLMPNYREAENILKEDGWRFVF